MGRITTEVEALDLMSQLGKELVTSYEAEDATVATIVAALLAFQVLEPAITVGTISGDYSALTRSIKVDGDTILGALFRLRDTVGGYIYVDNDRKLQWPSSLGEDKGQQIRYRKNLKGIERDIDYGSLVNRLYCYGAGEGEARIKLSDVESVLTANAASGQKDVAVTDASLFAASDSVVISDNNASEENIVTSIAGNTLTMTTNLANTYTTAANGKVNRGNDYIEDTDSQSAPPTGWGGIYVGVMVNRSITHPDTLLAWAILKLAEVKNPPITYSVDTIDLSKSTEIAFDFESLQLGSTVKVIDEDLGIDVAAIVVKITHPNLKNPLHMEIEIANKTKDITDTLAEVYDTQQLHQHIATEIGVGQVIVKGAFTVKDWVTDGETTIKGSVIETGTIIADRIVSVTYAQITDVVIATADIENLAVTNIKIGNDFNAAKITAGDIATARLQVHAADGINAGGTTISGGKITTNTIVANKLVSSTFTSRVITLGAGGKFVTGAAGTNRIEITNTIVAGINNANVTQFEIRASDGKAYFGAGAGIIDTAGIKITGTTVKLDFYANSFHNYISANASGYLVFEPETAMVMGPIWNSLIATRDQTVDLGSTTYHWDAGYIRSVQFRAGVGIAYIGHSSYPYDYGYFTNLYRTNEFDLQHLDDIALIRQMKADPHRPGFISQATIPAILKFKPRTSKDEPKPVERIDLGKEVSLSFGAIRQMAEILDKLESRMVRLEHGGVR